MQDKTIAEQLKEQLFVNKKNGCIVCDDGEIAKADSFCDNYKAFLNIGKTERKFTNEAVKVAKAAGFEAFDENKKYKAGDKVYLSNRGKSAIFAIIGKNPISDGVRILAAHIDSPRLDLKQNPLYEDNEIGLFKTHYYGGIKKYQWTALPLALEGVIVKADGSSVEVSIGEEEDEPKFTITDLLPHLDKEQSKRTLNEGIKGEELNILIGSRPFRDDKASELVKLNILKILNDKYGITEADFISSELELVPAFKASDIGFDRSMIGAYGHDDRVCAYPALMAILDAKNPTDTVITCLADKEEIGSEGNTGLQSSFLKYFIFDLAKSQGTDGYRVLSKSKCLSADVCVAFDPTFPDVTEKKNTAYLNHGVVMTKYTGARGKSGTSDASAEYTGYVRRLFDANGVIWQTGELGKVDMGGGGTVAMYIANLDVDVIDVGVPVLSMHSPYEVVSKLDVYMAYKAFSTFYK